MSVVVGCWCGRKRRQQYQVDVLEKGIPDHDNSGSNQQLGLRVSFLDERKVGTDSYNITIYVCMYGMYVCMCTILYI